MMADRGLNAYQENIGAALSRWKALLENQSLLGNGGFIDAPTQLDLVPDALSVLKNIPENKYVRKIQQNVGERIKQVLDKQESGRRVTQTQNWLVGCVKDVLIEVELEAASVMETTGMLEGNRTLPYLYPILNFSHSIQM